MFWLKKRAVFSKRDRDPYGLTAAPSARGSARRRAAFGPAGDERGAPRGAEPEKPAARTGVIDLHGGYSTDRFVGFVIYYISELDG